MADNFPLAILLPDKEVISLKVTEVVLPAHDGERGILAHHEDFVGILGTGVLKFTHNGDTRWLMVSSGSYMVEGGALTVLAEVAEEAEDIDASAAGAHLKELEPKLEATSRHDPGFMLLQNEYEQTKARMDTARKAGA